MQKSSLIAITLVSFLFVTHAKADFNTLSNGNIIKCSSRDFDLYFNQSKKTVKIVRAEDDGGIRNYKVKEVNSDGDTFVTFRASNIFDLSFNDQGNKITFFDSNFSSSIDCN